MLYARRSAPRRTFRSFRTHIGRALVALAVLLAGSVTAIPSAAASHRIDLRDYYPNVTMVSDGMYLEGFNYVSGTPQRSVLWFELMSNDRFRQYNWAPNDAQARCHYDEFKWGRQLRYEMTHDSCGDVVRETSYEPAIRLMPQRWRTGRSWSWSGTSDVTHTEDGVVACRGFNEWSATVLGWVEIAPGVDAIHVRSEQKTTWTDGHSSTGCSAGFVTEWQEDYYLQPDVPVNGGGTESAFKRSVGGNLSGGFNWDVWLDRWVPLPS